MTWTCRKCGEAYTNTADCIDCDQSHEGKGGVTILKAQYCKLHGRSYEHACNACSIEGEEASKDAMRELGHYVPGDPSLFRSPEEREEVLSELFPLRKGETR